MNDMWINNTYGSVPINTPKMHLLISVFLTDKTLAGAVSYGNKVSSAQSKSDQFLSVLHSISRLRFNSGDIYVSFDEEYQGVKEITLRTIANNFPFAQVFNDRLETFAEWKAAAQRIPNEVESILLKTNHDHAFVHQSLEEFDSFAKVLPSFGDRYVGAISHWPENIGRGDLVYEDPPAQKYSYFVTDTTWTIGTCLVSKTLFLEWWGRDFTKNSKIIRPDNPFGPSVEFSPCPLVIPTTEFFRHLDGYGHSKVQSPVAGPLRACCVVVNGQIEHREWTRGYYLFKAGTSELPFLPQGQEDSRRSYINLLLLASSHSINFGNMSRLLNLRVVGAKWLRACWVPTLLLNRFFLEKLPKPLLRQLGILKILKRIRTEFRR